MPDMSVKEDHRFSRSNLGSIFNVTFERTFYLGRGHGVPTGANVTVTFRNNSELFLKWGQIHRESTTRQVS